MGELNFGRCGSLFHFQVYWKFSACQGFTLDPYKNKNPASLDQLAYEMSFPLVRSIIVSDNGADFNCL